MRPVSYRYNFASSVVEALESRRLLAVVYPTAVEQYMVELINRARANPVAEAARYNGYKDSQNNTYNGDLNEGLPAGTINAVAKQPLAINPYLTDAARKHAQWMVDNDTFSHTGAGGSSVGTRITNAGYTGAGFWGENLAVNWSSQTLNQTTTIFNQHRNLFTDMPIAGRGHRTNMMNGNYKEVGVGVGSGPWVYQGSGTLNSITSASDFAAKAAKFLTGVAYTDAVADDNFYTPGEGLASITITAVNVANASLVYTTTTWSSGGYSLDLPSGTYNITGMGTGLNGTVAYSNVTIGTANVKRDFVTLPPPAPSFAKIVDRTLVVTGTSSADTITVYRKSSSYIAVLGSQSLKFSTSLIDVIAVLGLAGNDRITIGAGVLTSYVEGGDGKDYITGGEGADTLYGNAQPDYIDGGLGDDRIVGAGGNDALLGNAGNDRIYGNDGNDNIDAGAGNDRVFGGDGDDSIFGNNGNDILRGEIGRDTLIGGNHTDTADNDPLDTRIAIEVLA